MTKDKIQKIYKGFSNIPTFRVWFEMVKRDLSTDGIGLFSTSDDPLEVAKAMATYYIDHAEEYKFSVLTKAFIAEVNWEEVAERAISWVSKDHAAQRVKNTDDQIKFDIDYNPSNLPGYKAK